MFQELNYRYYMLYSELYQNKDVLGEKQFKLIQNTLYEEYSRELEVILATNTLAYARERYEMRYRLRHFIPHFGNKIARELKKELKKEFLLHLATLFDNDQAPAEEPDPCTITDLTVLESDV